MRRKDDGSYVFDYMIKDHLGNVRVVLTEEQKTDAYIAATLEVATIANESIYYGNLTNTQYTKPSWFSDPLADPGRPDVARRRVYPPVPEDICPAERAGTQSDL